MLQLPFNPGLRLIGFRRTTRSWGPFLERPGKLTGPKSYFEIKVSRKVGRVVTSNEVNFVSLADTFTVQFSNLLKLPCEKQNSLTGPVITRSFEKRAPGLHLQKRYLPLSKRIVRI